MTERQLDPLSELYERIVKNGAKLAVAKSPTMHDILDLIDAIQRSEFRPRHDHVPGPGEKAEQPGSRFAVGQRVESVASGDQGQIVSFGYRVKFCDGSISEPIDEHELRPAEQPGIWQAAKNIAAEVPDGEWDKVPTDLSKNPEQGPRFEVGQEVFTADSSVRRKIVASIRRYELTGGGWYSESEIAAATNSPTEEVEKPC